MHTFRKVFEKFPHKITDPEVLALMKQTGVEQFGVCKKVKAIGAKTREGVMCCVRKVGGTCADFWDEAGKNCPFSQVVRDPYKIDHDNNKPLATLLHRVDTDREIV